jgi:hypothetical protein
VTTSVVDFRALFPEFTVAIYPDATVNIWLSQSQNFVNPDFWGGQTDFGIYLLTAHELTLGRQNVRAAGATGGGALGSASGVAQNKTVDRVSIGYNSNLSAVAGAGPYNLTSYGQRYYQLLLLFGTGGLQVNNYGRVEIAEINNNYGNRL